MGRARAVGLAAALIGWSFVGPQLPARWRAPLQAGLGGLLALSTRASLGLTPPRLRPGLRWGIPVAAGAAAVVAGSTAVPAVRASMADRELPPTVSWLAWRIPVGTVWAEEVAFRAALGRLAAAAFGPDRGRLLQAVAFGCSHIADARATGEPVALTVLATGVTGWLLGWLADRTESVAAPMLAHLAINQTGALAAVLVQRRSR